MAGEVYREDTATASYAEHWVLYPNYVYPNAKNRIATELTPTGTRYKNTADFFARVPFAKGSRYVRVDCTDGTELPTASSK